MLIAVSRTIAESERKGTGEQYILVTSARRLRNLSSEVRAQLPDISEVVTLAEAAALASFLPEQPVSLQALYGLLFEGHFARTVAPIEALLLRIVRESSSVVLPGGRRQSGGRCGSYRIEPHLRWSDAVDEEFGTLVSMFSAGQLTLPVRKNLASHVWYGMSAVGRVITWTWVGLFHLAAVVWWRSRWWYAAAILVFAIWVTRPIDDWQANVIRAKILGDSVLFDEAYAMGLVAIAVAASDRWITPP